jgi:hypothetical protein
VRVAAVPYYRYKVIKLPEGDCRDLRGYGQVRSTDIAATVDEALPVHDGHYLLCSIGGRTRRWERDWQPVDFATVSRVRIDTVPPSMPAPIAVFELETGYRVEFIPLGNEISFYTFKFGPAGETVCRDARDYRLALLEFVFIPRGSRPQTLCAMPYDIAFNPGMLFERLLP